MYVYYILYFGNEIIKILWQRKMNDTSSEYPHDDTEKEGIIFVLLVHFPDGTS
jgi:hypothetical protein